MTAVLWVALGGAIGAAARYVFSGYVTDYFGDQFPWGILTVNVVGSCVMGLLVGFLLAKPQESDTLRLMLGTGVLGGFTTFSAFSFDVVKLMQSGLNTAAATYVLASVVLSILAVFIGLMMARTVFT